MHSPATACRCIRQLGLASVLVSGLTCPVMAQTGVARPAAAPLEVSSRVTPPDAPVAATHVDITRWTPPGRAGSLGLSFGLDIPAQLDARPYGVARASWRTDVGVRWRMPLGSDRHLDMAVWTRTGRHGQEPDALGMIWQQEQNRYGTRLEVQWNSSRTRGLVPEFGAVGLQLEGNSRLVLRARRGGPMLYYRTKF